MVIILPCWSLRIPQSSSEAVLEWREGGQKVSHYLQMYLRNGNYEVFVRPGKQITFYFLRVQFIGF